MLHIKFGFDWSSGFRGEEFEYYGNINVYYPGVGAHERLGSNFFQNHQYSVLFPISCKTFTLNYILTVFPIQMPGRPMLTLP